MADELELDVGPAQTAVLGVLARLAPLGHERVGVERAGGRTLAEALHARAPLPSAPLSVMDGYAVRSIDLRGESGGEPLVLPLRGESAAGHPLATIAPNTCVRISTGAVIPPGADAVVAQEDTRRLADAVEFSPLARTQVAPGRWIRPIGSDVGEGELLLAAGSELGPGELALLASSGHVELPVFARPKLAILASGDELVAIGQTPGHGQIVSTNSLMLAGQIAAAGGQAIDLGRVADRPEALRAALLRAIDEADLLIGTGGISVGDHDLVLPALRELDVELHFRRVRLRPGRPACFGLLPRSNQRPPLPVLALPGNPASTLVAFELLARPLLLAMLGHPRRRWFRRVVELELARAIEGDRKRDHYVRVQIDERGLALPLDRQLSGALRSIADFDALAIVPAGRERVEAGERVQALLVR
ncbi:gephyrin-like molybdotransferase Glp [Nannocystaceae bacterium ST9]